MASRAWLCSLATGSLAETLWFQPGAEYCGGALISTRFIALFGARARRTCYQLGKCAACLSNVLSEEKTTVDHVAGLKAGLSPVEWNPFLRKVESTVIHVVVIISTQIVF